MTKSLINYSGGEAGIIRHRFLEFGSRQPSCRFCPAGSTEPFAPHLRDWTNECRRRGGPCHTARRATKQFRSAFFVFYRFWFLLHRWQQNSRHRLNRHIEMRVWIQRRAPRRSISQPGRSGSQFNRCENTRAAPIASALSAPADRSRFARSAGILFRRGTGGQQTPQTRQPASRRLFLRQRASPFHKPWAKSVTARRAA